MNTITVEERHKIDEIVLKCKVCFVGFTDTHGNPYVLPMNFGYKDNVIYLHSALEGSSIEALRKDSRVCVTFCTDVRLAFQNEEVACSYRIKAGSVICRGRVVFEEDFEEKVKALDIIMKQYTNRTFTYSTPAVNNVLVWKVKVEEISGKIFGAPHPNSRNHGDESVF